MPNTTHASASIYCPYVLFVSLQIRDKDYLVSGLTFRIGRHLPGAARPIMDILAELAYSTKFESTSRA